ncbi:MAG: isochorismate synthase MenF, partial [Acidimicrobiia bacterium]
TVDPLELVRAGAQSFGTAAYFENPEGEAIGGVGVAWHSVAAGPRRFIDLRRQFEARRRVAPAFVGFSFAADGPTDSRWDGFPAATALWARITAVRSPRGSRLFVAVPTRRAGDQILGTVAALESPPDPDRPVPAGRLGQSRPSPSEWRRGVAEAVGAIRAGTLQKVVLARSVEVETDGRPDPFDLVYELRLGAPRSYVFAWKAGGAAFIGASPELLVDRRGDRVRCQPLAGSAPRGESEGEDRRLAESLIASSKDRAEHSLVVQDIGARLSPLTSRLEVPVAPSLQKLGTVQHLATEIEGTLLPGVTLLELVDALHPTPAVGGLPRAQAAALIDKIEGIDRGWYAGGVGWADGSGDGEIAVGLRCGLLRDGGAHLFAGAGIVDGSDPQAELEETRLKLRPLLELLTGP